VGVRVCVRPLHPLSQHVAAVVWLHTCAYECVGVRVCVRAGERKCEVNGWVGGWMDNAWIGEEGGGEGGGG
jgi:hypothetical protein